MKHSFEKSRKESSFSDYLVCGTENRETQPVTNQSIPTRLEPHSAPARPIKYFCSDFSY